MCQTVRPGNAYYAVAPNADPLKLGQLRGRCPYFPRFRRGMYEGGQG